MEVTEIKTAHVLKILEPMWLTKNETYSRLRGRIEAVMDYAKAMGWREGENPAKHHAALPVEDMPQFMIDLRDREAIVARLLEFIILTASRSGEARFATWDEIDLDEKVWRISSERMKMSKDHEVPLSKDAIQLIRDMEKYSAGGYIFEHPIKRNAFSINATRALDPHLEIGPGIELITREKS